MKDEDYNITDDQSYISSVSSTDCTGLIPSGTGKEKELEAYRELYSFGPPKTAAEKHSPSGHRQSQPPAEG